MTQAEAQTARAAAETALAQLDEMRRARESATGAAANQLSELATQRLAAITPYLHVVRVDLESNQTNLSDLSAKVAFQNVGAGPALSVRIRAEHPWFKFPKTSQRVDVPAEMGWRDYGLRVQVEEVRLGPPSENMPQELWLTIEYRDLAARWWQTRVAVRLAWVREGTNTYRLNDAQSSFLDDQSETVTRIDEPTIKY